MAFMGRAAPRSSVSGLPGSARERKSHVIYTLSNWRRVRFMATGEIWCGGFSKPSQSVGDRSLKEF